MINEKQIYYLLAVAEEHSITAAAQKLYISQPALSRMILDLEHNLGTSLFIRNRGNLQLTQVGEVYLRGCKEVLAISKSVSKEISDLSDSRSGRITLGLTSLTGEFLLPAILDTFEQEFPHVELVLIEERMSVLQEMVKSGKADMAFVYQTDDPELEYRLILENPIYLQVPPFFMKGQSNWRPGSQNPTILPESLSGQPMILLKKGRSMREMADRLLMQFQITPGKVIETENIHLARSLVSLNKGFTFVPSIAIHHFTGSDNTSFYCQVKDYPMKRSLYCCYRKHGYLTVGERFLINMIPKILV
ncbi:LysR substrate-binding domain-containing protein [Lacrimispora sp.]|uniref:LysR family transcriptional regulator n=1 Tax=Lacrimispora sp. TaxID=2719234 RepID=UPI00345F61B7